MSASDVFDPPESELLDQYQNALRLHELVDGVAMFILYSMVVLVMVSILRMRYKRTSYFQSLSSKAVTCSSTDSSLV